MLEIYQLQKQALQAVWAGRKSQVAARPGHTPTDQGLAGATAGRPLSYILHCLRIPVGLAQGGPVHRCALCRVSLLPHPRSFPASWGHPSNEPLTSKSSSEYCFGGKSKQTIPSFLPPHLPPLLLSSHPGLLKLFFQPLIPSSWVTFTNGALEGSLLKQFFVKNDLWPNTFGTLSAKQGPFASCLLDLSD